MHDTAVRLAKRLPGLFQQIAAGKESIDVVCFGQARAVDSGNQFVTGLTDTDPALKPLIGATRSGAERRSIWSGRQPGRSAGAAYRRSQEVLTRWMRQGRHTSGHMRAICVHELVTSSAGMTCFP
ncbi:hypothetical protein [Streptomyces fulvoviolaceus]|uniref:hypothetical protein n=1 Tax=Streptomyces fulvoviolaceus TaxID=285535 RepID=UPI0021C04DE6|nr:hypothetical protein [Streptomyces fulvoviolaceus]MCT9077554.1 hypothetical protein [Streptomyces fulvoviolaceus]